MRIIVALSFLLMSFPVFSQVDSLVNSGSVIKKGKILSDSGKYELAIREFARIDPRDTNYLYSISELAPIYIAC